MTHSSGSGLEPGRVRHTALAQYLQRGAAAAQQRGASRLQHYFVTVRPGCPTPEGYTRPAYLEEIREQNRWQDVTEIRTGLLHWGAEELERPAAPPTGSAHLPALRWSAPLACFRPSFAPPAPRQLPAPRRIL